MTGEASRPGEYPTSEIAERPADFTFTFHAAQRDRFRTGGLAEEWHARYPQLFDQADLALLKTEHQRRYHFFEWLSAILIFEATGYFSLVEGYTSRTHEAKRTRLASIVGPAIFEWLDTHQSGQPDLFVYEPAGKSWFFCEVKGAADRVRPNQRSWFAGFAEELRRQGIQGERVRVLHLKAVAF